tara:strand:- start:81678 stop:81821 length:144 start_codon:yes stop_codon:yes gene_type:complete
VALPEMSVDEVLNLKSGASMKGDGTPEAEQSVLPQESALNNALLFTT